MAVELMPSHSEDPFCDLSLPSLFPQTLGAELHVGSALETQESESIQNLFKSMAPKGSTKLLEQALVISTSSSSIQDLYFEAEDKTVITNGKYSKDPQGRRPALGRKRARFNLKSIPSDSSANPGIYDIVEPQEYFSAVDQMQKGEEEFKKCRSSAATDLAQHHQSTTVRSRRLGILGRTASYKHHGSVSADATEALRISQEVIPDRRIPSPAKISHDSESSNILPLETTEKGISHATIVNSELFGDMEVEGSVPDDLIEKLFSSLKDLNGSNGVELQQERLPIKSADFGKMILPKLDGTQITNPRMLKNTTTKKRSDGSQLPETISSTTMKSPLAVITNLQRRISLKDPLSDPYTMPPSDDAPYSGESMGQKVPLSSSADINHDVANGITGDGASTPAIANDTQINTAICAQPDNVVKDLTLDFMNQDAKEVLARPSSRNMDGISSSPVIDVGAGSFGDNATLPGEVNVTLEGQPVSDSVVSKESSPSASNRKVNWNNTISGNAGSGLFGCDTIFQDKVNIMVQGELLSDAEVPIDNASHTRAFLPGVGHSENLGIFPEENNETHGFHESSAVSPDSVWKRKAPSTGQNRKKPTSNMQSSSRRQSLADGGLIWKSGVRRSTRIKSRPLQYWCGERFLYGRIHDSLATVIGLKYACPGEDGKSPVLKVKSFVREEYADLVSRAAV